MASSGNIYKIICIFGLLILPLQSLAKRISITKSNRGKNYAPGDLIFSDEFQNLNLETWFHENTFASKTWEFQAYVNNRSNSFVHDEKLFIKPTLTAHTFGEDFLNSGKWNLRGRYPTSLCTDATNYGCVRTGKPHKSILNPVMSAKLSTVQSFYFTYGKVVIRAKLPAGDWMWPSIKLKPRFNNYGKWPLSGEIVMMESRGNQQLFDSKSGANIGTEKFTCGLHFGPNIKMDRFDWARGDKRSEAGKGFDREFHNYELVWTKSFIGFYVDTVEVRTIWIPKNGSFWNYGRFEKDVDSNPWESAETKRIAPFDHKFYLAIKVAVGGQVLFPDKDVNKKGKKPWKNNSSRLFHEFWEGKEDWFPTWEGEDGALQLEYVKVYAI